MIALIMDYAANVTGEHIVAFFMFAPMVGIIAFTAI